MLKRLTDEQVRALLRDAEEEMQYHANTGAPQYVRDEAGMAVTGWKELLDARTRIAELEAEIARLRGVAEYVGSESVTVVMLVEDEAPDDDN